MSLIEEVVLAFQQLRKTIQSIDKEIEVNQRRLQLLSVSEGAERRASDALETVLGVDVQRDRLFASQVGQIEPLKQVATLECREIVPAMQQEENVVFAAVVRLLEVDTGRVSYAFGSQAHALDLYDTLQQLYALKNQPRTPVTEKS